MPSSSSYFVKALVLLSSASVIAANADLVVSSTPPPERQLRAEGAPAILSLGMFGAGFGATSLMGAQGRKKNKGLLEADQKRLIEEHKKGIDELTKLRNKLQKEAADRASMLQQKLMEEATEIEQKLIEKQKAFEQKMQALEVERLEKIAEIEDRIGGSLPMEYKQPFVFEDQTQFSVDPSGGTGGAPATPVAGVSPGTSPVTPPVTPPDGASGQSKVGSFLSNYLSSHQN